MSISKSYNKNTGITYVYDVYENYWDKKKKKYVQKRKLIGKIDPETGEVVPTRSRKKTTASIPAGSVDYESLYRQAAAELEQKDLQISLLQTQVSQLKKQLASITDSVLPALEKQVDLLKKIGKE